MLKISDFKLGLVRALQNQRQFKNQIFCTCIFEHIQISNTHIKYCLSILKKWKNTN